jgi:hypothetical protein
MASDIAVRPGYWYISPYAVQLFGRPTHLQLEFEFCISSSRLHRVSNYVLFQGLRVVDLA